LVFYKTEAITQPFTLKPVFSMTHFVSIISYEGGFASYQFTPSGANGYTAQLVKSTTAGSLPAQVSIHRHQLHQSGTDTLMDKLVTAIKMAEDDSDEWPV
jgi:hypothetical protein